MELNTDFCRQFARIGLWVSALLSVIPVAPVKAAQWLDPGDERARHYLQVLYDSGHVSLPLMTWPVSYASVQRELDRVDPAALGQAEILAYDYLKAQLGKTSGSVTLRQRFAANTNTPGFTEFGTRSREELESRTSLTYSGRYWDGRVALSAAPDSLDGQTWRLDGSYISGNLGNWRIGGGAIDRWWGPGWQSSLILSTNARPSPGLFVSRIDPAPFDLPVLRWIGPWNLDVFLNQLEDDRGVPNAKLFGMRVGFKPWRRLEIGVSRTAQWGGDGRPEDADAFWDMLRGRDNRGSGGIETDASNEPGNQLAGADFRLNQSVAGIPMALYSQIIGEDEAGGLPSRLIGLVGMESSFTWGETSGRIILEGANTTARFYSDGRANYTYEHTIYTSGYRYRGRAMGASMDGDSEVITLKGLHLFPEGQMLGWSIGRARINKDGTDPRNRGGNTLAAGTADLWYLRSEYSFRLWRNSEFSIGGEWYEEPLRLGDERVDSGIFASYTFHLQP